MSKVLRQHEIDHMDLSGEIEKIVTRSQGILERMGRRPVKSHRPYNLQQTNRRLERWRKIIGNGDPRTFHKRLEWSGWEWDVLHDALEADAARTGRTLPQWAETLREILIDSAKMRRAPRKRGALSIDPPLRIGDTAGFEDFYRPFIRAARAKLASLEPERQRFLARPAHEKLEVSLVERLVAICQKSLEFEFEVFCSLSSSPLGERAVRVESPDRGQQVRAFVARTMDQGLLEFFQEYSVLARLAATVVDLWAEAIAEFLRRLDADWDEIVGMLGEDDAQLSMDRATPRVVDVDSALSDHHHGGRCVMALTLASGARVVYKPKDLGMEVGFNRFLCWINERRRQMGDDNCPHLRVTKILARAGYGWMEFVVVAPCSDVTAAGTYYRRAGMLLSLLYAFGSTDFHHENLIADGAHPVLIDLETLIHPRERLEGGPHEDVSLPKSWGGSSPLAGRAFGNSVLRCNLLPYWQLSPDGLRLHDASGLEGAFSQAVAPGKNIPAVDGIAQLPRDFVDDLMAGFQEMYQFLMATRDLILADDGPLSAFANLPVRFVFRPTKFYIALLQRSLRPDCLRDGRDWSIELDVLCRHRMLNHRRPAAWPLLDVERRALDQLDVPHFVACTGDDSLVLISPGGCDGDHRVAEQVFDGTPFQNLVENVLMLDTEDMAQQSHLIQGVLIARGSNGMHLADPAGAGTRGTAVPAPLSPVPETFIQHAREIARGLQQSAISAGDGVTTWIGLSHLPDGLRRQFQPLGYSLYDGISGVALFFAALGAVTQDQEYITWTLDVVRPLHRLARSTSDRGPLARFIGIGGGKGLGSIVYALTRISSFLRCGAGSAVADDLLEDAECLASLITPELIASDRKFDIISGAAGSILGLLALDEATNRQSGISPSPLERMILCGRQLVENRAALGAGPRAWLNYGPRPLTGFSHGAAGIAYSLLRLYHLTGDGQFLSAAEEGIAYEREQFSPSAGNWPDFRSDIPRFACSWCHGAPGIGLGRLGSLGILDDVPTRREIDVALATTEAMGLRDNDQLCCGNLGRLDLLLTAARMLRLPQLLERTLSGVAQIVCRSRGAEGHGLSPGLALGDHNPGLFQGIAGMGYELVRFACPEKIPTVLLWE